MDFNTVDRQISITPPGSPGWTEEHLSTKCKYIQYKVEQDGGYPCYVWLRKCVCGQKPDKTHLVLIGKMSLGKQDGVDIHFSDACDWEQWSIEGGNLLKRSCFEETHFQSAGTMEINRVSCMKD